MPSNNAEKYMPSNIIQSLLVTGFQVVTQFKLFWPKMSTEETREDDTLSSSSSDSDNTFDDWVEDPTPCKSLFEDVQLNSVEEAIKHDREKYGFDLNVVSQNLSKSGR